MVDTLFHDLKSVCVKSSHTTTEEQFTTDMLVSDFRVRTFQKTAQTNYSCPFLQIGGSWGGTEPFCEYRFSVQNSS